MSTAIADVTLRDRDAVLRLERTTRPAQGSFTLFMYTLHDGIARDRNPLASRANVQDPQIYRWEDPRS
jgi:hypothetical protein